MYTDLTMGCRAVKGEQQNTARTDSGGNTCIETDHKEKQTMRLTVNSVVKNMRKTNINAQLLGRSVRREVQERKSFLLLSADQE